ncbi:MAG: bifunctional glutamate N-acetyltransferase/amino-acid acetyltransferase ArgJ [Planctomycetota bacterium]|jgi:glutamate N-acetyltransferase/amino-acid N-acetyltransferase|nr:bifunctional glutamate N-acetyltransferase/amino-acid acetyltransferase ArgJ [Planctomycetota bacterium]
MGKKGVVRHLEEVGGFRAATLKANIRDWEKARDDLALIVADSPAAAAGVFTRSRAAAAPVTLDRRHLKASAGLARAVLVNAGVANACTGRPGAAAALASAKQLATLLGAPPEQVLVASTGVIGRQLPREKMQEGINKIVPRLGHTRPGAFARAILTTDLRPKESSQVLAGLEGAVIAGACKGSGMIAPHMATMLAFILTDAWVSPAVLQEALARTAELTFNRVTVDGDTSTNDSLFILASGNRSQARIDRAAGKNFDLFLEGLYGVSLDLARQIAFDGEGATKLVTIRVSGGASERDAKLAGRAIAESPLVKTAMFGNDPNWGRIMMAVGKSGARMVTEKTTVSLCQEVMFRQGAPVDFAPAVLSKKMRSPEVEIAVELGLGKGEAVFYTCDFSYDYVKINADYTT